MILGSLKAGAAEYAFMRCSTSDMPHASVGAPSVRYVIDCSPTLLAA